MSVNITKDNGGRRSQVNRRNFSYTLHFPQRRSGRDRRSGLDRRKKPRYKSYNHNSDRK